jgi:putative endonuclease
MAVFGNRFTGWYGEAVASAYLALRGMRILARNVRTPTGELDIVGLRRGVLHIVEVRTVRTGYLECPTHAVDRRKQVQVIRAARSITARARDIDVSFDIVGVRLHFGLLPRVTWIRRAFGDK